MQSDSFEFENAINGNLAPYLNPSHFAVFLYPPSQDSVFQVTEHAYKQCDASDPISKMNDGNSLFNVTTPGNFYFISGAKGHCEKHQKIAIQVATADGKFFPPEADSGSPAGAPSYPTVFGPMPMGLGSGSGSGAVRGVGRGGLLWVVGSVIGGGILWGLL